MKKPTEKQMKAKELKDFREKLLKLSVPELLDKEIRKEIILLLVCLGDLKSLIRLPHDSTFTQATKRHIMYSQKKAEDLK